MLADAQARRSWPTTPAIAHAARSAHGDGASASSSSRRRRRARRARSSARACSPREQLADFVRARRATRRASPCRSTSSRRIYITEGEHAGVRGDVAFAQSILETGGFTFPGGGQVLDQRQQLRGHRRVRQLQARLLVRRRRSIGVRAQMQALRIYVDPDLTETTLKQPLVMPKMLNLGFRGKVQTWWDLWGTWATGAFYGQRVYDIYERMVEFARPIRDPTRTLAAIRPAGRRARAARPDAQRRRQPHRELADAGVLVAARPLDRARRARSCRRGRAARRARRGSRGGRGSRRGSGARRGRSRGAGSGRGATSKRNGSANTSSSRFADASQNTTLSPAAISCPPSSTCAGRGAPVVRGRMRPAHDLLDRGRHRASRSSRRTRELVGELRRARRSRRRSRCGSCRRPAAHSRAEEELQLLVGELRRILARQRRVAHDRAACRRPGARASRR